MNSTNEHISIKNLIKIYKRGTVEVTALRGINLAVQRGEFIAIVGSSGSGKTTLMNIIGGISTPTAGNIVINGEDISDYHPNQLVSYRKNTIGFLWQIANLLPDLNVEENLRLTMLASRKFSKKSMKERVDDLLEVVKMTHRKDHRPSQLSGGELQRAALAVALANDPEIILADEPTGELDTETGEVIMNYLKDIANRKLGKTLIVVTHALEVAELADRAVVIHDGVLISQRRGMESYLVMDPQGKIQF
ncbi:MAG: ABC transporter ATP-binding protein, partial [Candidatus Odinarchaeota archaeon]